MTDAEIAAEATRRGFPTPRQVLDPDSDFELGWTEAIRRHEAEQEDGPPSTWTPVDLTDVLSGTYEPLKPTVGKRTDGAGLFYPGRIHTVAADSEAGKTWLALTAAREEMKAGNAVLYLDFEDDAGGIVPRLLAMGTSRDLVRSRFVYVRPEEPITERGGRAGLRQVLGDLRPTLAVIDGVTEAMTMHGLEMKDNSDIARFGKLLPRWLADRGPATVALDHVVKDRENRGRYAIGGVHKLNGVNGAAYVLENRQPFGAYLTGRSGVYIAKDRPGQLRMNALPGREGLWWYADLVVQSHDPLFAETWIYAPQPKGDPSNRPTHVMAKVSKILESNPAGLSKNSIETLARGKASVTRAALELLVAEGYARAEKRGAAIAHFSVKPFTDPSGDES
ncbi:MAG TPA: AAA family ATPase [Nocardioidaceae bacterium]